MCPAMVCCSSQFTSEWQRVKVMELEFGVNYEFRSSVTEIGIFTESGKLGRILN